MIDCRSSLRVVPFLRLELLGAIRNAEEALRGSVAQSSGFKVQPQPIATASPSALSECSLQAPPHTDY